METIFNILYTNEWQHLYKNGIKSIEECKYEHSNILNRTQRLIIDKLYSPVTAIRTRYINGKAFPVGVWSIDLNKRVINI